MIFNKTPLTPTGKNTTLGDEYGMYKYNHLIAMIFNETPLIPTGKNTTLGDDRKTNPGGPRK